MTDMATINAAIQAYADATANAACIGFKSEIAALVAPLLAEANHQAQEAAPVSPSIIAQLQAILAKVT